MSESSQKTAELLTEVRERLLDESRQAAARGGWEIAKKLMEQAEAADRLHRQVTGRAPETPVAAEAKNGTAAALVVPKIPLANDVQYPKYFIRDGALVKQGLQRQGDDIYEHLVPLHRYEEITERLKQMAARQRNRQFTIDNLQKELDCPRYMTYVVVSMLMREGILVRPRKGRYVFAAPEAFGVNVEKVLGEMTDQTT